MNRKFICAVFASTLCLAACERSSYSPPPMGPEAMVPSAPAASPAAEQQPSSMAASSSPASAAQPVAAPSAMSAPQPSSAMVPGAGPQGGCAGAYAWGGRGPMRGGMGMGIAGIDMRRVTYSPGFFLAHSQELGLSADQVQKIRNDMFATHQKVIDLRARSMKSRAEVNRLLSEPKVDANAVDRQIQDSANAMAEIRKLNVQSWLRTRALLNAEQLKKLDELRAQAGPGQVRWRTSSAY